jgi:formate hydrogenlyase subunit 3/multisubunit Na+/H+ antiporter MnhD subunit
MDMNATLSKALFLSLPIMLFFVWSLVLFVRRRAVFSFLQLFGAGCLVVVIVAHISEALNLFPFMRWGSPHSVGHYLDFASAILGITLSLVGYFLGAFGKEKT